MFVDMLAIQREMKYDLSSVETGIMAGAPCPQELCKNVVDEMNMKDFVVSVQRPSL
jgi:fatty-acyl-CoA synthase